MKEIFAGKAEEFKDGHRIILNHEGQEIGVIRARGRIFAFLNICPHQGGPVCEGLLVHKVEEVIDEDRQYRGMRFDTNTLHIVCPWHGWEFNVEDGACAGDGQHVLKRFEVEERDGDIYVRV